MNNSILSNLGRFILVLAAQVLVFNNIDLFGFINPFPYILFILLYPATASKPLLYVAAFFLGLSVDMFENSGGVHAASCLILAAVRPNLLKFSFGVSFQYHQTNLADKVTREIFKGMEIMTYIILATCIHHFVLFSLEFLRFNFIWEILLRTLLTTVFTILTTVLIIFLIKPSKK